MTANGCVKKLLIRLHQLFHSTKKGVDRVYIHNAIVKVKKIATHYDINGYRRVRGKRYSLKNQLERLFKKIEILNAVLDSLINILNKLKPSIKSDSYKKRYERKRAKKKIVKMS